MQVFQAILLGPTLAPLAGGKAQSYFYFLFFSLLSVGLAAHYYSWRFMQLFLGLVALLVFFIIIFFLPETSHPNKRGVDNLDPGLLPKWRPVMLNPLQPFWLLRSPNVLAVVRIIFSLFSAISRT